MHKAQSVYAKQWAVKDYIFDKIMLYDLISLLVDDYESTSKQIIKVREKNKGKSEYIATYPNLSQTLSCIELISTDFS